MSLAHRFEADRLAQRVFDHAPFAVAARQHRVLLRFESGQSLPFGPDRADHLSGHVPLGVGPAAGRKLPDSRQPEPGDPRRAYDADLVGDVGKARMRCQAVQDLCLAQAEDRGQLGGGTRRVLDLVRGGVDVRRIFGAGKLVALAVKQAAAQPRDGDHPGLLGERLGGERRALHPLQPEGAPDDDQKTEQKAGEEEPYAALDQAHRRR